MMRLGQVARKLNVGMHTIIEHLEKKGFEVVRSTEGAEALNTLDKEAEPSVIIMDLMMPEMNGQECIRHIRALGIECPIIAFTATDDEEVHQEAKDAGCDLLLTKPTSPKDLVEHVMKLLGQAEA